MSSTHVSRSVTFSLKGGATVGFEAGNSLSCCFLPTQEQLQEEITSIQFAYSYSPKQDVPLSELNSAFGVGEDGIVTRIPNDLTSYIQDDVIILKYGCMKIDSYMLSIAGLIGLIGCWDSENLIFCATKGNNQMIKNILNFLQPNKVRFDFCSSYIGHDFIITSI